MRAGAEGESGIERHDHGARLIDALVARANPQPPAEAQRMKVLEPFALPDAVGDVLRADQSGCDPESGAECVDEVAGIVTLREQAPDARRGPQAELPRRRLQDWVVVRIDEG